LIRAGALIPWAIPTAVSALIWSYLYDGSNGIISHIFAQVGLIPSSESMLLTGSGAMSAAILTDVWKTTPYMALLLLAGLQVIPENLYEAAEVDGASRWQKTIKITIPMLANTTFVVVIMLVIEAFNIFEAIFVMTEGGPVGSTTTLMYYIYDLGFKRYNMGYASAVAWVFFAMILLVTLIQYAGRREQKM
jgi:multiple sugar transport system permease protein